MKHWITLNEPWSYSNGGYAIGAFAPGRCSEWQDPTCLGGDSGTEPYIVTHNLLLSHAAAVDVYRNEFKVVFLSELLNLQILLDFHIATSVQVLWYNSVTKLTFETLYPGKSKWNDGHNNYC